MSQWRGFGAIQFTELSVYSKDSLDMDCKCKLVLWNCKKRQIYIYIKINLSADTPKMNFSVVHVLFVTGEYYLTLGIKKHKKVVGFFFKQTLIAMCCTQLGTMWLTLEQNNNFQLTIPILCVLYVNQDSACNTTQSHPSQRIIRAKKYYLRN